MSETENKGRFRWYEVLYVVLLVGLLGATMLFMNPHRTGVLDLERLSRALGQDVRMAEDAREQREELATRGAQMERAHEEKLAELNRQLKTADGAAEKARLQETIRAAQTAFQEQAMALRREAQRHQALVLRSFHKRIQPHIEKVARRKRLDVVLEPGMGVLYRRAVVDITEEVARSAKRDFPATLPLVDPEVAAPAEPPPPAR